AWPAVAAALMLVPTPAWIIETFYARGVYRWLQSGMTLASNLVPIAVLDVMLGGALLLVLIRGVQLWRVARRQGVLDALWEGLRRALRAAAIVLVVFVSAWGCNYRRVPLDASLGMPPAPAVGVLLT